MGMQLNGSLKCCRPNDVVCIHDPGCQTELRIGGLNKEHANSKKFPGGVARVCGIAGYWGELPVGKATAVLKAMNASLIHRGPDGEGIWVGSDVGLAHRRLAIIDLPGGAQPMVSADDRYRIVFNGEIYNHRDLRHQLTAAGYKFLTRSDTEVIPAAIDH